MTGLEERSSVRFADRFFVNPTREVQILAAGATYTISSILEFVRRSGSASVGTFVPSRVPLMNDQDLSRTFLRARSAFSRISIVLRRAVKKRSRIIFQATSKAKCLADKQHQAITSVTANATLVLKLQCDKLKGARPEADGLCQE